MKTSGDILPGILEFRRRLHQVPELAGEERETSRLIRERLKPLGFELFPPFLETDVVALLRGGKGPGRNVTLRADTDALSVEEATGVPYRSTHPGKMHACGHDAHISMVMGAAELLAARRDEFAGSVRFVFQPGEENRAMARDLLAADALENPKADVVAALHGMPGLPVGMLGVRTGAIMASSAHFRITLHGRGGHSSTPHLSRNPVTAAAALIHELEGLAGRTVNSQVPSVLTVCRVAGGELENVIPESAVVAGTARSLSDRADAGLEAGLRRTVAAVAAAREVSADVDYRLRYPVTVNAPGPTDLARKVIRSLGLACRELPESAMAADDFAWYLKRYPGVYLRIGTGENSPELHNSKFLFPEEALRPGIEYLTEFALATLR